VALLENADEMRRLVSWLVSQNEVVHRVELVLSQVSGKEGRVGAVLKLNPIVVMVYPNEC
jgi:hypothetical protein